MAITRLHQELRHLKAIDQKPLASALGIAKVPQKELSQSGWSMPSYGEFHEFQAVE